MTPTRREFAALGLGLQLASVLAAPGRAHAALATQPLVIAMGGAGGDSLPAWTAAAYDLAIRDGADVLAACVVSTKDGRLAVRPSPDLSESTDVASRPEFAARRKSAVLSGGERQGWFSEDFTLAELRTLTCDPPSARRRAGVGGILSFEELTAIARAGSVRTARVIGVQAAIVEPAHFSAQDLAVEPQLAAAIRTAGYDSAAAAMFVASDSADSLRIIKDLTAARRVLRIGGGAAPTPAELTAAAGFAWAIAPDLGLLLDLTQAKTTPPTSLVADAHAAGLAVEAWAADPPHSPDMRRLAAALFAAGCEAVAAQSAAPIARARADLTPAGRE